MLEPKRAATARPRAWLVMRSVVSSKIGKLSTKNVPSLPTGSSTLPSEEKTTACIACVWMTDCTSGRARMISV